MWKLLITQAKPYTVAGFFFSGVGGGRVEVKINIYFIASILYFKTRYSRVSHGFNFDFSFFRCTPDMELHLDIPTHDWLPI